VMRANLRAIQVTYKAYPHLDRVLPAMLRARADT